MGGDNHVFLELGKLGKIVSSKRTSGSLSDLDYKMAMIKAMLASTTSFSSVLISNSEASDKIVQPVKVLHNK